MAGGRRRRAALGKRLDRGSEVAVRLDGHKKDLLVPSLAGGLGVLDLSRRLLQPRTDDASDRAPLVEENASVGLRKIDGECDGSVERNEIARNLTAHGLCRQVDLQGRDRSVDLFLTTLRRMPTANADGLDRIGRVASERSQWGASSGTFGSDTLG